MRKPHRTQLSTLVALLTLAALAAFTASSASAISDSEELGRFGSVGEGAGQLEIPWSIATDPTTGHVFVVDGGNHRINEFTPWGNFVKAFGWDVAPGAVNEQQEVRVRAASGQFKLSFGASTTADLAFDAPGTESEGPGSVEAALNALPSIGSAGGSVSVKASPGTADGAIPSVYVIVFKGSLAGTDVEQIAAANGTVPLGGGKPTITLEARTRADGTAGGAGLESCTTESGCKHGLAGDGAGEIQLAIGVALDAAGNLYVSEEANFGNGNARVQKFDPADRFLLMFGGEVNKTKTLEGKPEPERNRCTKAQLEAGDVCGAGTVGSAPGQFGPSGGSNIAFGSTGKLFVSDDERIQRFDSEGDYEASVPVTGETVHRVAIAPGSGDFYAQLAADGKGNVLKLDAASGAEIGKLEGTGDAQGTQKPTVDPFGNIFVVGYDPPHDPPVAERPERVLQFDSAGKQTAEFGAEPKFPIYSIGTNAIGDVYVGYNGFNSFIRSFGPAPVSFEAPPRVPPQIGAQFATSVGRNDATLAAEINPHFWTDTRYHVQYGTGKCSEGGCEEAKPLPPGAILTPKVFGSPVRSAAVFLEGLKPGTTYHYRFVAVSSGGGPVQGEERTLITYPAPAPPKADCPNQAFRTGFSAPLADCRAYEMVSPIDKDNGDIKAILSLASHNTALDQSSADGERFTYSSYRAFADPKAAPYASQYLARRENGVGWSSEALSPPQGPAATLGGNIVFENPFKAFSPDLCKSWLSVAAEPVLAPGASEGYRDFYRRDDCGAEGYEALIQVEPTVLPAQFEPVFQGASADGREAIFQVKDKLSEGAASGRWQAYYASEGGLHLICVLPSGLPSGGNCSGGSSSGGTSQFFPNAEGLERLSSLSHALSEDGSRAYWTDTGNLNEQAGPGKVYLRLNPAQEQSALSGGECTEAEKACTVEVSETVTSKAARFLGANPDGSKALFEVTEGALAGNLYEFDLEAGESTLIAKGSLGVTGSSEDLSRVYFASTEAIAAGGTKGAPNLYLAQEGTTSFIATLSQADVTGGSAVSDTNPEPIYHAARASADGNLLAFISTESLSGYDNTDQATGEADSEVYLYEAGAPGPVCVSCNPSRARPQGRVVEANGNIGPLPTAASIPLPQFSLNLPRGLSADGRRLFFDSYDALLPRDTNGKEDVYEWEAASGQGQCEERGAEIYVASSEGCLSLISSGESPDDSQFLDAGESGDDAFFTTNAGLLPQDPGLIDVYDARANGGLPAPPAPPGPCQGEACLSPSTPPDDSTPASASFKGAGNPHAKAPGRCAKGKARRKGRCVATKHKRAKHKRGSAR